MSECYVESYDSAKEAERVLKSIQSRLKRGSNNRNNRPKRVYKCESCGKYHITGKKKDSY